MPSSYSEEALKAAVVAANHLFVHALPSDNEIDHVFSKTSPMGKTADVSWKSSGMTDDVHFLQQQASGNWTALIYGTNIARPTGDRMMDLRSFGSISYKSAQMTISYVLE